LKAIAADDELAEAHTALADIRRDRWQWDASIREYQRAIALSSSYVPAHEGLAIAFSVMAQDDAAIAELSRIRDLDPVGLAGAVDSAALFYNVRRFDRALDTLREAQKRDNQAPALWTWTGIVNGGRGDMPKALDAFETAIRLGDTTAATLCYYIHALARTGHRDEAVRRLDALERSGTFVPPSALAIAHVGVGGNSRAIQLLEQGFAVRDPLLQYIVVEPFLSEISDDARFRAIVAGMGLPMPKRN
jgi:tetratricopeptide (TPR) repeat protein